MTGCKRRGAQVWDDQTQTYVYESSTRYNYLDYSLQKPFSTVEELVAYETRIYLNEVRDSATGEVTLDPVLFDAYTATDDVEVRYQFAPLHSGANNGIWEDAARALAWRHAVGTVSRHVTTTILIMSL